MKRRSFLKGLLAVGAARLLPKVKQDVPKLVWTQHVYGAPIVYYPRRSVYLLQVIDSTS